ncbi:MAG: hypothetical protein IPG45_29285 [Deltaproteobacteria bacterium]|nr:hypothetical protein [Deltaproteobacteria bacterium]
MTLLLAGVSGLAASPSKAAPTVIIVAADQRPAFEQVIDGFIDGLKAQGLTIVRRDLDPDVVAHDPLAADLVLALGSGATAAVLARAHHPPLIHAVSGRPPELPPPGVGAPIVAGVSPIPSFADQLALVRAVAPNLKRIGVVGRTGELGFLATARSLPEAQGLTLVPLEVAGPEAVAAAILQAADQVDGILAGADPRLWNGNTLKAAVISSLRVRRPLFGMATSFTKAGALASVAAEDYPGIGAEAARLAQEILAGRGQNLPRLVSPKRSLTSINLVVADRLGIRPTRGALDAAHEVFQ